MKEYRLRGPTDSELRLAPWLVERTRIIPDDVQRMLDCGAVVVRFRGKGPWVRVRDGRLKLHGDDQIHATYEPSVLALPPVVAPAPLWVGPHYGVWVKPSGVMSQGTAAGDHCSLLRAVEKTGKKVFLVHRLDRETEGLILIAFTPKAAAQLSDMFQKQEIHKTYLAQAVRGDVLSRYNGLIDAALDGKKAETAFIILGPAGEGKVLVELRPLTGRLHQLRRHLALVGSGIWGDPKYGTGNKNRDGLRLAAVGLSFQDPFDGREKKFSYEPAFQRS